MLCVSYEVFLSSELQAAQIVRSKADSRKQEEGPVCEELLVICETLNLPGPRGQDAAVVLSQVQDKVGLSNIIYVHLCQSHQHFSVSLKSSKLAKMVCRVHDVNKVV